MATEKQKIAAKNYVENHGNASRAMLDAGYTPATAKNPQNLTESKGFRELIQEAAPSKTVKKVLREGLRATHSVPHIVGRDDKGRPEYEYIKEPDFNARHKYLKTALEVHGVGGELPPGAPRGNTFNFFYMPEMRDIASQFEQKIIEVMQSNVKQA